MSASLIFQSAIRESTISTAATSPAVAASACAGVQCGPVRSVARMTPISASTRGAMNRSTGSTAPSRNTPDAKTGPKSGESTPSSCCIGRRRQPQLVADDRLAIGHQPLHQVLLDRVPVLHAEIRASRP